MINTIFLDFETLYSTEYSLRRMTPAEYILDPRFETNGLAVKEEVTGNPYWLDRDDVPAFFNSLDPNVTSMVTHNALFDMCIVAWRYNFVPRLMVDTMGIARGVLGHCLKHVSLQAVSQHLGLGSKGAVLMKVKGMNLEAIKAAGLYDEYVEYGLGDVEKCAGIYDKLVRSGIFPISEMAIMDMVLRLAVQPQFLLDQGKLAEHLGEVKASKDELLANAMLTSGVSSKDELMSNPKFAEVLSALGVTPPEKISPTTGKTTFAFSKSDVEFLNLQDHPDPRVQTLMAARMGHKSTLEETRCKRFLNISNLTWPGNQPTGSMPVPLRYGAAHTHRLGGDWKLNMQNLTRGGKLRDALQAPDGYKVETVDSAQIEARLTAWICKQQNLVDQFANGEDVYSLFASDIFNTPVDRKNGDPAHESMGFVGKQGILGLGFGLGHVNFRLRLETDSKNQTGTAIEMDLGESKKVVDTYRNKFFGIPATWRLLNGTGIDALVSGNGFRFGPCIFEKEAILLPNGLRLHYHELHREDNEWWFVYGGKPKKLYGGKLLENIVQALDRIIIMDAAARLQIRLHPYRLCKQDHDENSFIIPDHLVEEVSAVLIEEMCVVPAWAQGLPLKAEVGVGQTYGDAK